MNKGFAVGYANFPKLRETATFCKIFVTGCHRIPRLLGPSGATVDKFPLCR